MYEKQRIRRILLRNTLLFFVVFSLIFSALGVFVYQVVSSNIYRAADQQLTGSQLGGATIISAINPLAATSDNTFSYNQTEELQEAERTESDAFVFDNVSIQENSVSIGISSVIANLDDTLQVYYILRNEQGELIDATGLYRDNAQDFFKSVPFSSTPLDEILPIEINNKQYRTVTYFLDDPEGESYYLQSLINVDSEIDILSQFTKTLVISLLLALFACAGASYLLSKRTIRPIAEAWQKQSEFIQNASHELRTPLAVIHATQELLMEDPQGKIIDHFEDINLTLEESNRLRRLAEELLTLSVADSETDSSHEEDFDLSQLLNAVGGRYKDYAHSQKKVLEINLENGGTIPGDRSKIERALNCLLENAFTYTETGDIVTLKSSSENGQVIISISDTGIGISEEDRKHVFERFYRADKARNRKTEGAGLGLSIARDLIESQKGSITLKPNHPKGTTAIITLPKVTE